MMSGCIPPDGTGSIRHGEYGGRHRLLSVSCADASHGFQTGVRLGNPKEAGDWAASLLYEYIERDATLSAFSWSDFGTGGTNQEGPVLALDYQLFKPLTLTARSYFTKFIDPAPDINNRMQVRLQLDAQLRF